MSALPFLFLLGVGLALPAAADDPPPVASIKVYVVKGTQKTPLDGVLLLRPGTPVDLLAEARDRLGLALATRPAWRARGALGATLAVQRITGVARLTAPDRSSGAVETVEVRDARAPRVHRAIPVWTPAPPPAGRPDAVALYLADAVQLRPIVGRALFARPGQRAELVVLGRYPDGRWRAATATLSGPGVGRLTRLGPARWSLVAGRVRDRAYPLDVSSGAARTRVDVQVVRY